MYYAVDDKTDQLEHHGIKGQKWGVRRFQRADGTRTPAGKKREQESSGDGKVINNLYKTRDVLRSKRNRVRENEKEAIVTSFGLLNKRHRNQAKETLKSLKVERDKLPAEIKKAREEHNAAVKDYINENKDGFKKAAAIGAGLAVGAVLLTNPTTRNALAKYGKTALNNLPNTAAKVGAGVGKTAAKFMNKTDARMAKVGDAMLDAALASVGSIAIAKVGEKLAADNNATQGEKNKSKILTDATTAGIKTATGAKEGYKGSSSNPNAKVDKNSKEYQELFPGLDDADRKAIKDKANSGATIEELQKFRESLGHSDFESWASQYFAVEIGR